MELPFSFPVTVRKIPAHDHDAAHAWVWATFGAGLHIVQCLHDDHCKSLVTHRDADCAPPCKPDFYLVSVAEGDPRCN